MKKKLVLAARIITSILFLFSAISKIASTGSINFIELEMLQVGVVDCELVEWVSRLMIAFEFFLGLAILQPAFLKRIVVPSAALLLISFTGYLIWLGGDKGFHNGNCGCFGDLLPMSPFSAIVKNVLSLGILGYLFFNYKEQKDAKPWVFLATGLLPLISMFAFFPFTNYDCELFNQTRNEDITVIEDNTNDNITETDTSSTDSTIAVVDTLIADSATIVEDTPTDEETTNVPEPDNKTVVVKKDTNKTETVETPSVQSEFSRFTSFSGGKTTNLDKGLKIVCMYSLTCDHCQKSYREIAALKKKMSLPETYLIFLGDKMDVPYFFEQADTEDPYVIIGFAQFIPLLGDDDFPKVVIMKNGKKLFKWDFDTWDKAYESGEVEKAIKSVK